MLLERVGRLIGSSTATVAELPSTGRKPREQHIRVARRENSPKPAELRSQLAGRLHIERDAERAPVMVQAPL